MKKANVVSFCAMLLALALALSYAERLIPLKLFVPLPGIKLGLANIVTLVALYLFKFRYCALILLGRCILGALFGGGITGFLFSLWGGALALGTMALARKSNFFSPFGVSVLGAAAHSIGQILAAMALMQSVYIGAYLPYLLLVSIATGLFVGAMSKGILHICRLARISLPKQMTRQSLSEDSL